MSDVLETRVTRADVLERAVPVTYGLWSTARTNLAINPRMQAGGYAISRGNGAANSAFQLTGGPTLDLPSWRKDTYTLSPTSSPITYWYGASGVNSIPVLPSTIYTISSYAISSYVGFNAVRLDVTWYNAAGVVINSVATAQPAFAKADTWERRVRLLTSPADAAFARVGIAFSGPTGMPIGTYVGVTGLLIEVGSELRPFFDGNTPNNVLQQSLWNGAVNTSTSSLQTRPIQP